MFAKLRAIAGHPDTLSLCAIAAVSWGLLQLGKMVEDRSQSIAALTSKREILGVAVANREAELAAVSAELAKVRQQLISDSESVRHWTKGPATPLIDLDSVARDVADHRYPNAVAREVAEHEYPTAEDTAPLAAGDARDV